MIFPFNLRSQIPSIIVRLKAIRLELNETQNNIESLVAIEKSLTTKETDQARSEKLLKIAINDFGVAMWIKDLNSRFVYVNKTCCDTILQCSEDEASNSTNGDFENDALSQVCMESDQKVIESQATKRFIEHAIYEHGHVFLDVIKSPIYDDSGRLAGTMGNAVNITNSVPGIIKKQRIKSNSTEIPVDTTMSPEMFVKFLERRKRIRIEKEDNKMGTRLRRRRKTRIEKINESKGKTPKRLRDELNRIESNDINGRKRESQLSVRLR
jgi:PAS domain S-box-containing protein